MILAKAQDLFTEAVKCLEGVSDGAEVPRDIGKAEEILNMLLNHNVGNVAMLSALGSVHFARGNHGLAIQLYSTVVAAYPNTHAVWNNLGLCWKEVGDLNRAEHALQKALKLAPPEFLAASLCNLAAVNLNRGRAAIALEYTKKALAADPSHAKSHWHYALANLELRNWEAAWEGHEARLYGGSCQVQEIEYRNYHGEQQTPIWEGQEGATVVVHGEEGVGDEVMFASCIPDLIAKGCNVIIEPHPRLEGLFRRSFPQAKVYGTHKTQGEDWIGELGPPDYKIALGSLPKHFRNSTAAFPGTPYLIPDRDKASGYRARLSALPARPNIGIAWQGGVERTRYAVRSFHPEAFKPLFDAVDANWISLQYDQTAEQCVADVKDKLGVTIHHWPEAVGMKADIDETAALISSLDLVITVCQTAYHIAGALGVPTLVLTPSEPDWRIGCGEYEDNAWYRSVRLLRQAPDTYDWAPVIERAAREARQVFDVLKVAAQ